MEVDILDGNGLALDVRGQVFVPVALSKAIIVAHFAEEDSHLLENPGGQDGCKGLCGGSGQLDGLHANLTLSQHLQLL